MEIDFSKAVGTMVSVADGRTDNLHCSTTCIAQCKSLLADVMHGKSVTVY